MLEKGATAPDFRVGDTSLHALLREKKGAVVFFFPKTFTPGWTREAGGFRREYEGFERKGVEIIGVSADSQQKNDEFRASLELPYPLVGDPDGKVRDAYQVKWPLIGLARRTTYVIGADRKVKQAFRGERDVDAHVAGACRAVEVR